MIKILFIFIFFTYNLNAFEASIKFYNEYYKNVQNSSLNSLYTQVKYENIPTNYLIHYNISFDALNILNKSNTYYDYLSDKYMLRSLSIDYYNIDKAISIGRNYIILPMLKGSFDGVMYYHIIKAFSYRLYYFNRYEILLPSYYEKNNNTDLKGINFNYITKNTNVKFAYIHNNNDNFYHTYFVYLNNGYNYIYKSTYFNSDEFISENIYKIGLKIDFVNSSLEFGTIQSSKNGIDKILEFESEDINNFGLDNSIYYPNSSSSYIEYLWYKNSIELNILFGINNYKQNNTNKTSKELDIELSYNLSDNSLVKSSLFYKDDVTNSTLANIYFEYKF